MAREFEIDAEEGYFIAVEVEGGTETSQHWVAVDRIVGNIIYMLDPVSDEIDMWRKYDWNLTSQFVFFKTFK